MRSQNRHERPRQPPAIGPIVVTEQDAAKMLSVSTRHLQRLRGEGEAPPTVRLGPRRIGYRVADLEAWLSGRLIDTRPPTIATPWVAK